MAKGFTTKGRSSKTYKNKIRELTKRYNRLFKASQARKSKNPQGTYFCDKYPTADSFLKTINIKKENISGSSRATSKSRIYSQV